MTSIEKKPINILVTTLLPMKTLDAVIKTNESLTAVIDGTPFTISAEHPAFNDAVKALSQGNVNLLHTTLDLATAIKSKFESCQVGGLTIENGNVYYEGELIHNYVVDKILEFMKEGLPFKPLVNFLEKLLENPSRRAINELYSFLEHKNMPICEDGDFLAYKSVRQDFRDHHSGKFSNHVGAVLSMPRNAVCDDAEVGCSYGFHAGSHQYASSFGGSGKRLVIVKINPADVVSVPKDCDCQKLRTSRYEVIKEFTGVYKSPMAKDGEDYYAEDDGYEDEDYDDYDDYEDYDGVPYGVKPSGQKYHNQRDCKGRFMKRR